ncbi:hypothetical protein Tco_0778416 [Tanacetum coccineum]
MVYFMKKYKNLSLKRFCWAIGSTTPEIKFVRYKREIKPINPEAWWHPKQIDKSQWCLSCGENQRWGFLTTNISKSNNNALRGVRGLPIKSCIDLTFNQNVTLFEEQSDIVMSYNTPLPHRMWRNFNSRDICAQSHHLSEFNYNDGVYKIVTKLRINEGITLLPLFALATSLQLLNNNIFSNFTPFPHVDYWLVTNWKIKADNSKIGVGRGRKKSSRIRNETDIRHPDEPKRCGVKDAHLFEDYFESPRDSLDLIIRSLRQSYTKVYSINEVNKDDKPTELQISDEPLWLNEKLESDQEIKNKKPEAHADEPEDEDENKNKGIDSEDVMSEVGVSSKLFAFAQGWGGKYEGLGLVACATENVSDPVALELGSTLHFKFYAGNESLKENSNEQATKGLQIFHLPEINTYEKTDLELLHKLVEEPKIVDGVSPVANDGTCRIYVPYLLVFLLYFSSVQLDVIYLCHSPI